MDWAVPAELPDRTAARLARRLIDWFEQNARDLPWRRTRDPYAIWISEVMLQQTRVPTVIPYWERWLRRFPNVRSLASAKPAVVLKLWEGLGYYSRARNLHQAARIIQRRHQGKLPRQTNALLALPGIGPYAAGAIGSIAFNQPTPVLDGNVIRVLTRLFGIGGNPRQRLTNERLWRISTALVEAAGRIRRARSCAKLNESLMELGALVCTPRAPRCPQCPIRGHCVAFRQNRVAQFPRLPRRATAVRKSVLAFIISDGNRYLIRQRETGKANAQLWEFPNCQRGSVADKVGRMAKEALGFAPEQLRPFLRFTHTITRYRITIDSFRANSSQFATRRRPRHRWGTLRELDRLPFASAHRKIVNALMADEVSIRSPERLVPPGQNPIRRRVKRGAPKARALPTDNLLMHQRWRPNA